MRFLRSLLLLLLTALPLITLVHKDDLHRWDTNREAMIAPDEFSYLLMADNLVHGHGISTAAQIGRDTFYPPGLPLMLAGWWAMFGESIFSAHTLDATLLCLATLTTYFMSRALLIKLALTDGEKFTRAHEASAWLALLITALFCTNWHVLESGLYFLSEPAFMLTTFSWILLALRWKDWDLHPPMALLMVLLAIAAWSIRGAGVVCVAATFIYPFARLLRQIGKWNEPENFRRRIATVLLVALVAVAYQWTIIRISPEKSLASAADSDNSYPRQLFNGLTDAGRIDVHDPHQYPHLIWFVTTSALSHLDDFSASFTPWFREPPGYLLLNYIGKTMGILGLLGFLYHLLRRKNPNRARALDTYLVLYIGLYLAWPFNFARFWSPILPLMLGYGVDALRLFGSGSGRTGTRWAFVLLALLLALSAEELLLQLNNYQRRLNYVSDCLADTAAAIVKHSPSGPETLVAVPGDSEHFVFAWYLPRERGYVPTSPYSHLPTDPQRHERIEAMLARLVAQLTVDPRKRLFMVGYFNNDFLPNPIFSNFAMEYPALMADVQIRLVYRHELIVSVWAFERKPQIIKK